MSTETSTATGTGIVGRNVRIAGALGGLLGSVVFGAMIQLSMPPTIAGTIPAPWGLSGLGAGWVVHLVNRASPPRRRRSLASATIYESVSSRYVVP